MSVKVAKVMMARTSVRDEREAISLEQRVGCCSSLCHEDTKARRYLNGLFSCFRIFVVALQSAPFEQQTPERRDHEPYRLIEAVGGDRLALHAAAVAGVAAPIDRAVAVEQLGVPASGGDADPVVAARHGREVED